MKLTVGNGTVENINKVQEQYFEVEGNRYRVRHYRNGNVYIINDGSTCIYVDNMAEFITKLQEVMESWQQQQN